MSVEPPFRCVYSKVTDETTIEIRFVEPDSPFDPSDFDGTREMIELFAAAVNEGLFPSKSETNPEFAIVNSDWNQQSPGFRVVYTTDVDRTAWLHLLGLLSQTHCSYEAIEELTLTTGDTIESCDELRSARPSLNTKSAFGFEVAEERSVPEAEIEILIEFESKLRTSQFEALSEAINIWDHIRILGGFEPVFDEVEEMPALGRTVRLGPNSMSHSVAELPEDTAGLDSFFRLVGAKQTRECPVRGICIQ